MTERAMVIIGSGEAGARAAVELRTQGWSGPITLIGRMVRFPYERPPLSKGLLFTGKTSCQCSFSTTRSWRSTALHFCPEPPQWGLTETTVPYSWITAERLSTIVYY